jgi:hypothetical protein
MRLSIFLCLPALAIAGGCRKEGQPPRAADPRPIQQDKPMADEAQARKARSIAILKKEGVPFIEHLPLIETEAEAKRRTTEEVALRAMALCIVAVKGEGIENKEIRKLVQKYQIADSFTPEERRFIDNPKPSEHDRIQFSWRYECYWVTLWALGFVDDLSRADKMCDVPKAVSFLRDLGRDGFLKKAKLRPAREILDAADLIYRYHWATTDARINNPPAPAGLDSGVVQERHYVLNWLIGYMDQEWDDVTSDT